MGFTALIRAFNIERLAMGENRRERSLSREDAKALLIASRPYAEPIPWRTAWALATTLVYYAGLLITYAYVEHVAVRVVCVVLFAGAFVRIFVLQHDAGHRTLFRKRRYNDLVGQLLTVLTGVPYAPWREEHAWHHQNQGRLDKRGVDRVNSPMTAREAIERPDDARLRDRLIVWPLVVILGIWSLVFKRKRLKGFFFNRPGFSDKPPERAVVVRSYVITLVSYAMLNAAGMMWMGWLEWITIYWGASILASVPAATLFWLQHNFERSYHREAEQWSYAEVACFGSSYVALGPVFGWYTANIGLHHVHHLNARIPCYRLEEARRALPIIKDVPPLGWSDLRRCFTHVFWDEQRDRMVVMPSLDGEEAA